MTPSAPTIRLPISPRLVSGVIITALIGGCSLFADQHSHDTPYRVNYSQGYIAEFSQELSNEYLRRAKEENYENNYDEEEKMLGKSRAALQGHQIEPEQIYNHDLEERYVPELIHARRRLMWVLSNGGPRTYARQTAVAQVTFDCWVEEQDENYKYQQHEVNACKSRFFKNLTEVEANLKPHCGQPQGPCSSVATNLCHEAHQNCYKHPKPSCNAQPTSSTTTHSALPAGKVCGFVQELSHQPASYIIYFDTDSSKIRDDAISTIRELSSTYSKRSPATVSIQGHTDRAGESGYNNDLSQRRVQAAITALHLTGIPQDMIQEAHFGELRPRAQTRDGEANQQNRRVEIQVNW